MTYFLCSWHLTTIYKDFLQVYQWKTLESRIYQKKIFFLHVSICTFIYNGDRDWCSWFDYSSNNWNSLMFISLQFSTCFKNTNLSTIEGLEFYILSYWDMNSIPKTRNARCPWRSKALVYKPSTRDWSLVKSLRV